jgi:hypothetical protein
VSPKEFKRRMREIWKPERGWRGVDTETAHMRADDLMCELLESLGYGDGVTVFKSEPKWYA